MGCRTVWKAGAVVLSCLILGAGLTACGGGDGDTTASSSETSSSNLSGTVTVWDLEYGVSPSYTKAIEQIDAKFEKLHPGVKVDRVAQPFETFESLYQAAFTAREGPDLMMMPPAAAGVLRFKQGLEKLDDRISPQMQDELVGWEEVSEGYSPNSNHYGVPFGLNGQVIYYNKKLFAEAGLPREFEPETWTELIEAGEKLKAAGITPFAGGNKEGYENLLLFSAGWSTDNTQAEALELAEGEMSFTDDAVSKAFQPGIELQEAGLFPSDRFSTSLFTEGYAAFGEEKGAMVYGFWTSLGYWGEFNPKIGEKNLGMFFPPGAGYIGYDTYVWSMPTFAKNKDAAFALAEFSTTLEAQKILDEKGGLMSNRKNIPLAPDAPIQKRQLVEAVNTAAEEDALFPFMGSMIPGTVPIKTEMNEVLQGRTSLEDAQQSLQDAAEQTRSN